MPEVTRRRLLSSAAAGAGGVLASSFLPPALARAAAEGPRRGSLSDVKHVVIHMQENRSFDHYFGTLAGVARVRRPERADPNRPHPAVQRRPGQVDLLPVRPAGSDRAEPRRLPAAVAPGHEDDQRAGDPVDLPRLVRTSMRRSTSRSPTTAGSRPRRSTTTGCPLTSCADGDAHGPYTMGYYERQDIPFHFALAETFTLCDAYHCSLLGPTWPNRMYLMTGMIDPDGHERRPDHLERRPESRHRQAVHLDDLSRSA